MRPVASSPSTSTRPASGGSSPAITLNNVDLPQPLGPITETNSPGATSSSTPSSTGSGPGYSLRNPSRTSLVSATAIPRDDEPFDGVGQQEQRDRQQRGDQHGGEHEVGAEGVLLQAHEDPQPCRRADVLGEDRARDGVGDADSQRRE